MTAPRDAPAKERPLLERLSTGACSEDLRLPGSSRAQLDALARPASGSRLARFSYFLARLETFEGLMVLATNRADDLAPAVRKRSVATVPIPRLLKA